MKMIIIDKDNHQHHLDDQDGGQVGCFLQEEEPLPPTPLHQVVLLIFSMSMSQCRNWWRSATSQTFFSKTIVIAILLIFFKIFEMIGVGPLHTSLTLYLG